MSDLGEDFEEFYVCPSCGHEDHADNFGVYCPACGENQDDLETELFKDDEKDNVSKN